jgi:phosphatidylserine/phosphatidylglycerophosphate/cardiolipin synthase-like enzyme
MPYKETSVQVTTESEVARNHAVFFNRDAAASQEYARRFQNIPHTKFMVIDPLGDDPIVVTGSANFSESSTTGNDENMLFIRGNSRVADIYLGEYMRLWNHYAFRE